MKAIRSWSLTRVLLTAAAWILLWPLLAALIAAGYVYFQIHSSQEAGIGAVSVGISELTLVVIAILWLVPPMVLLALWRARRTRIISARSGE